MVVARSESSSKRARDSELEPEPAVCVPELPQAPPSSGWGLAPIGFGMNPSLLRGSGGSFGSSFWILTEVSTKGLSEVGFYRPLLNSSWMRSARWPYGVLEGVTPFVATSFGLAKMRLVSRPCAFVVLSMCGIHCGNFLTNLDLAEVGSASLDLVKDFSVTLDLVKVCFSIIDLVKDFLMTLDLVKVGFASLNFVKDFSMTSDLIKVDFSIILGSCQGFLATSDLVKVGFASLDLVKDFLATSDLDKAGFASLDLVKDFSMTSDPVKAYASYMKGTLLFEQDKNWETALMNFKNARAVYEELGKYGDVENQVLCHERVEELEPSIRYCLHKVGESSLQTSELLDIGKMEGPALDLFKAKLEAVMAEARSQQAASMTEFHLLGHRFPINNAKTRVSILKAQELEKDLHGSATDLVPAEKKLAMFDKIFSAYHDARSCIRNDLATAGNAENVKDDLNGLDKAVSAVLGQRTIERNLLLVTIAKSKFTRYRDDKGEKITKPEELVRLYDLLIQNATDLSDLVSSGRDRNPEEAVFAEEYVLKGLIFRAERCFYLAKSYSSASKRMEAFVLFCHARSLADTALQKLQMINNPDKTLTKDLKVLSDNCRSNSCIEHAAGIMEEERIPEKLSKGVSTISLTGHEKKPISAIEVPIELRSCKLSPYFTFHLFFHCEILKEEKFLLEMLDGYESAVGNLNTKAVPHIECFPPPFQAVPCNPIVLDIAYNSIEFPSLENRMKKDKKGIFSRLWR
ncbi:hypothetical protein COCNU_scaffold000525G000050 [Cocos nucifera]|nr:hypothetical protein [Cocos nucifera]